MPMPYILGSLSLYSSTMPTTAALSRARSGFSPADSGGQTEDRRLRVSFAGRGQHGELSDAESFTIALEDKSSFKRQREAVEIKQLYHWCATVFLLLGMQVLTLARPVPPFLQSPPTPPLGSTPLSEQQELLLLQPLESWNLAVPVSLSMKITFFCDLGLGMVFREC